MGCNVFTSLKKGSFNSKMLNLNFIEGEFSIDGKKHSIKYVNTNRNSVYRTKSLFTKEPTTIPWLEAMEKDSIFVDIGANVGMYSIYAAVVSGAKVYSFEPESQNYAEINKNIFLNNLHGRVLAYSLALGNENKVSKLHLSRFVQGSSEHDFDENWRATAPMGTAPTREDAGLTQGCVSVRLDDLIANGSIPMPNHIKIDIDGFEGKVIEGAMETLKRPELKSILIETDFRIPDSVKIIKIMEDLGWKYSYDQVCTNRKNKLTPEQLRNHIKKQIGGTNFIYYKDERYAKIFKDFAKDFVPPSPKNPKDIAAAAIAAEAAAKKKVVTVNFSQKLRNIFNTQVRKTAKK